MSMQKTALALALTLAGLTATSAVNADVYSFVGTKNAGVAAADVAIYNFEFSHQASTSSTGLMVSDLQAVLGASAPESEAQAQTLQGVNRISVLNDAPVSDEYIRETGIGGPFSLALSVWSDGFVMTGGSGFGTAEVSTTITGQFGGLGAGGEYSLFYASATDLSNLQSDPIAYLFTHLDNGPSAILTLTQNVVDSSRFTEQNNFPPGSSFGGTLTGTVNFTYGETFYLVSMLAGFANDTGSLSALNSAEFGISVAGNPGAQITSSTAAIYPLAAVPEPETYAMMLVGLGLVGFAARRRTASPII